MYLNFLSPAYYGLFLKVSNTLPYNYNIEDYKISDSDKIKIHKELLEALQKKEEERLNILDTKTSQLITFTGIIFSALSLFIPILLDKIADHSIWMRTVFIIVLVFAFLFYVLTIHNAIRNYNVGKFRYSNSSPVNVLKYQDKTVIEFNAIIIRDLLYSYNQNLKSNNDKANNLIYAYRAFRIANYFTAFIGILICYSLLFAKPKDKGITIKDPVQIELDSTSKELINTFKGSKITTPTDTSHAVHKK